LRPDDRAERDDACAAALSPVIAPRLDPGDAHPWTVHLAPAPSASRRAQHRAAHPVSFASSRIRGSKAYGAGGCAGGSALPADYGGGMLKKIGGF